MKTAVAEKELLARDLMNPEVVTVEDVMTVREAADLLIENEISGAPVEDRAGKVVGVVSFADIALAAADAGHAQAGRSDPGYAVRGWQETLDPEELGELQIRDEGRLVREIMTPSVYWVAEDAPLSEVARIMLDGHVHRVLVYRGQALTGIISSLDLLRLLAEE